MIVKWGWAGLREGFHRPILRRRRAFTRFGPKTTVLIGPIVIWIYWEAIRAIPKGEK